MEKNKLTREEIASQILLMYMQKGEFFGATYEHIPSGGLIVTKEDMSHESDVKVKYDIRQTRALLSVENADILLWALERPEDEQINTGVRKFREYLEAEEKKA
jgi:hypothetical protein